jgi:hypothetical protein
MAVDRLADIQAALTDLYEQLAGEERAWRLAEEAEKSRLQQKIRLTWQRIRESDREYVSTCKFFVDKSGKGANALIG